MIQRTETRAPVPESVLPTSRYPTVRVEAITQYPPESLAAGSGGRHRFSHTDGELRASLDTLSGTVVLTGWIAPDAVDTLDVRLSEPEHGLPAGARRRARRARRRAARCEGPPEVRNVRPAHGGRDGAGGRHDPHVPVAALARRAARLRSRRRIRSRRFSTRRSASRKPASDRRTVDRVVLERQLASWGAEPDGYLHSRWQRPLALRLPQSPRRSCACWTRFARTRRSTRSTTRCRSRASMARCAIECRERRRRETCTRRRDSVANARSLSGYALTADNHLLIFSLLANNWITSQCATVDSVHRSPSR